MTDKELRKLKRSELLEILYYLRKEVDDLTHENESLKTRLDDITKSAGTGITEQGMQELTATIRTAVADSMKGSGRSGKKRSKRK